MKYAELVKKAHDIMRSLEQKIGETIGLGVLLPETAEGLALAFVEGTSGVAYHIDVGYHFVLHTSAPGKALLAYLPEKERNEIMSRMGFKRHTPSTIVDRSDFQAELDAVIEKGYSIDVSEYLEGCHCVGVPVFDGSKRVVAALWTTGPSAQLPVRRFADIAEMMKKGAGELSLRLRASGRNSDRAYVLSVVEQAREIIDQNIGQTIDMKDLAQNLYVSYSWFRKVFKEQTGEAPSEYHLNRRMVKACELLSDSGMSIRQISEELGFKNQNHFSALFKRKTGLSPLNYRQTGRSQ